MKVIKPITFSSATHLSSSTAGEAVANWSSSTNYAIGARARVEPYIYQATTANTNKNPTANTGDWFLVGPDNKHSMFDGTVSTVTTATTSLTVVLRPGLCNSMAFFGLVGSTLQISVKDQPNGTTVYTKTFNLNGTDIFDWYDYFFEPYVQISEVVLTDLPPFSGAEVTMVLSGGTGSTVEIGSLVWGSIYTLGATETGVTLGIIDYSKKETDEFGVTNFVERDFSKRVSCRLFFKNNQINRVQRLLSTLRATPCVWIPSEDPNLNPLTVFGFYKDFNIEIPYPDYSYCSLEIEGLT